MKHYSLKLRKILLYDSLYYILIILSLIYIFIYSKTFILNTNYNKNNNKFYLKINNYIIDGNKLSIDFDNLKGIYYFETKDEINLFKKNYNLGDTIEVNGTLEKPNNNTIPNTFNYKKYLYHKRIEYILKINNLKKVKNNKSIPIKIKNYILKRIENIKNNKYLYAFILGKSSYIDIKSYNNYKINGVTHLFALSGLHVSLFSSIILYILNKLKLNEKVTFTITSIFLITFSFIASFTPSILRATIFFILSSVNKIYYFFIKPKNLLYLTFTILIFINPFYIFDTGFILSFTITYFILLMNEKITIEGNIKSILIVSMLSFLSSLPIIINLSYEINIIGFINNIFFIPLVTNIIFPLSLMTILVPKLSIVLFILTSIMEKISAFSCTIFNIVLYFQKINYIEIFIYYILLILSIKKNKKILIILLIFIFILYIKPYFNKNTYVYFIDVGQGDLELIVTENKESILIDTGGKLSYKTESWKQKNKEFNLMTSSVIQFIKSIGLKKIDYLIITHGDYDHMGEAINLVNNFKVDKVIFNCGEFNELEKELIKVLDKKKIKYYSCLKELNIDDDKLFFLNNKDYGNENNNSSVIYTELNNYKFLFMGDAGVEVEKDLIEKYNLNDIDVLKVGHHGSNTSSSKEFIDSVNPKYSIISVGKNNRYNHPKDSVLETLSNSKIYRTDIDGSIEIKINKNGYKIKTCPP